MRNKLPTRAVVRKVRKVSCRAAGVALLRAAAIPDGINPENHDPRAGINIGAGRRLRRGGRLGRLGELFGSPERREIIFYPRRHHLRALSGSAQGINRVFVGNFCFSEANRLKSCRSRRSCPQSSMDFGAASPVRARSTEARLRTSVQQTSRRP